MPKETTAGLEMFFADYAFSIVYKYKGFRTRQKNFIFFIYYNDIIDTIVVIVRVSHEVFINIRYESCDQAYVELVTIDYYIFLINKYLCYATLNLKLAILLYK